MENKKGNNMSSPVLLINISTLLYIILWIVVPSFQNAAGGIFFRLIFFVAIVLWFLTSFMIKINWISKLNTLNLLVFFYIFQKISYLLIGYGDMSLLNLVSPLLFIIFIYIGSFYLLLNNQNINKIIVIFSFILIILTSITTLSGLISNPNASRYLSSSSYSITMKNYLAQKNIGDFNFIYSLTVLMPALIVSRKLLYKNYYFNKFLWLLIIFLFAFVIFYSNFFISYILLFFSFFIIFFSNVRNRTLAFSILSVSILLIITILPGIIVFLLDLIQNNTTSLLIQGKIASVKELVMGQGDLSVIGSRYNLIGRSMESFFTNPIVGAGAFYNGFNIVGGHSQLLDDFARFGMVGGLTTIMILFYSSKLAIGNMKTAIGKNAIFFSWISYIILNLLNPAQGFNLLLMIFLLLPIGCKYFELRLLQRKDIGYKE